MKLYLKLLFFVVFSLLKTSYSQVNVSVYGAVGDGVNDDTQAIQNALNANASVSFTNGNTYRVSGQITMTNSGNQSIVGNGATIIATAYLLNVFYVDKPTGVLTVDGLNIDGQSNISRGWRLRSSYDISNCNIVNLYSNGANAIAWYVEVLNSMTISKLDDCDCDNIKSVPNNILGDAYGAARCFALYWRNAGQPTSDVVVENSDMGNIWGDDGDVFDIFQSNTLFNTPNTFVLRNCNLYNASRRLMKLRASNMHLYNNTFTSCEANNPNLTSTIPTAGQVVLASLGTNYDSQGHEVIGNTFIGTSYENRLLLGWVKGVVVRNNTFVESELGIFKRAGDVCIQDNTVDPNHFAIYNYQAEPTPFTGPIVESNTMPAGNYINFTTTPPAQGNFVCPLVNVDSTRIINICKNSSQIAIDGVEELAWSNIVPDTIDRVIHGMVTSSTDAEANYKLMWDSVKLYVLVNVTDDILTNDSQGPWNDDGIELFIDGNNDKATSYDADDKQYIIRWNDNTVYEYSNNTGLNPQGVNFAQTTTVNGYIIEGAIEWSALGVTVSNNHEIGFDLQLNDDDTGGNFDSRLGWNAVISPNSNPSLMGVVNLGDGSCGTFCTPSHNILNEVSCGSYSLNNQVYQSTGVYNQTLTNSQGCDSVITLNLTVNNSYSTVLNEVSCGSYTLNNQTYQTSGTYTQTFTSIQGCDSVITINLLVSQSTYSTVNEVSCGDYTLNNQIYTTSGVYTQTLINSQGCDSLITLNLQVNSASTSIMNVTSCGDYTLNGQTYTTSGAYTQTLTNSEGCDSVITLNLSVGQNSAVSLNESACSSYVLNGQEYFSSGTYTQTLNGVLGCDSVITLNLTLNQMDLSIVNNSGTLHSPQLGVTYQWYNCTTDSLILNENNQFFNPQFEGVYGVVLDNQTCVDTSECYTYSISSITQGEKNEVSIFPNPVVEKFNVASNDIVEKIEVYSSVGQILINKNVSSKLAEIDIAHLPNGVYTVRLAYKEREVIKHIVKL